MEAVANGKTDVMVAATFSMKVARWIRFLVPSTWNRMLVNRYEKSRAKSD